MRTTAAESCENTVRPVRAECGLMYKQGAVHIPGWPKSDVVLLHQYTAV